MSCEKHQKCAEPEVIVEDQVKEPKRGRVVLLNDDYTSMEFVVRVLVEVFHMSNGRATTVMMAVHQKGRGECGVFPLEVAETKASQVHAKARAEGFPLRCAIEEL